ncbi:MAG: cyclic nucleotide-binding domain-containing protein [Desulfitobacteriia bacterium]|jgi:CRP-like cAMP-binding protein
MQDNPKIVPDSFHPIKKLRDYAFIGNVRGFQKGDTVVLPGEKIHKVIYVLAGKLSVSFLNDDGKQKSMYTAGRHSIVDRLFPSENCFVHVVSEENSTVCFFTKEQLFLSSGRMKK